jgi:hypothetical protein
MQKNPPVSNLDFALFVLYVSPTDIGAQWLPRLRAAALDPISAAPMQSLP